MAAFEIRKDRTPAVLRREAKAAGDARVARRILAIANALDGISLEEAARAAGMDRQTLRDWVIRYNAHGLDGLSDRSGAGRPPRLTAEEQAELMDIVLAGSDPEATGISAYTREDLAASSWCTRASRFQSTPACERATFAQQNPIVLYVFQSTPACERATAARERGAGG